MLEIVEAIRLYDTLNNHSWMGDTQEKVFHRCPKGWRHLLEDGFRFVTQFRFHDISIPLKLWQVSIKNATLKFTVDHPDLVFLRHAKWGLKLIEQESEKTCMMCGDVFTIGRSSTVMKRTIEAGTPILCNDEYIEYVNIIDRYLHGELKDYVKDL